jgi:hypothetical protein
MPNVDLSIGVADLVVISVIPSVMRALIAGAR